MANKQRSQIYEDVVQLLKKGSYTTLQIAEKMNINWETAKNAVETLKRINLLSSVYIVADAFIDALFKSKFDFNKKEEILNTIYSKFNKGNYKKAAEAVLHMLGLDKAA